ncbi:hypothetical protein [Cellvibrio japonicus]|uniref:Uncharacterized protein n=1 Tax=Cellvibrio japonicus (strain Ueda107) TaxID=498211 RepID=B3PHT8_CELJU|nr:hypothetical protein [Cellvibrio japonicus]ACE85682.1 hypothetical protein CJA_3680 [Cellvibrio japonicus Ueda107]QEI13880.1 hypothetical protein FY117_17760 [Cellvibrio japonicus]QEI17454.1 hypothetical protein FY116_17765 [Cellvibrio japonicus]QEI21030.1 hypothetical protein FY115_17760 [Cellvibrio japonicus]
MQTTPTARAREPLHIYLTLAQSSLVLEALVEKPFKEVFELIGKLNHQAQPFYQPDADPESPSRFVLEPPELSLCVRALGDLPYNRVCSLVALLHQQLQAQQAGLDRVHTP